MVSTEQIEFPPRESSPGEYRVYAYARVSIEIGPPAPEAATPIHFRSPRKGPVRAVLLAAP